MRGLTLRNQGPLFDNKIFHAAELCLLTGRRIRETAPPTPKDQKEENIKMRSKANCLSSRNVRNVPTPDRRPLGGTKPIPPIRLRTKGGIPSWVRCSTGRDSRPLAPGLQYPTSGIPSCGILYV